MAMRILVVDDVPVLRIGAAALLDADPTFEVVGSTDSADEACRLARTLEPDVVVIDLHLAPDDGKALDATLLGIAPQAAVVHFRDGIADEKLCSVVAAAYRRVHGRKEVR